MAQLSKILKQATGVVAARGEGVYLFDEDDRRYLDFTAGIGVTSTGHCHPRVVEAAQKQVATLIHGQYTTVMHRPLLTLVERMSEVLPDHLDRMFFANSGSEAVEAAWKLARQYHAARGERRWKVIARRLAYHGTTTGALSITGCTELRTPFEPLVPDVLHVSNTNGYHRPPDETEDEFTTFLLDELEATIEQAGPGKVAMVIMEPFKNSGGSYMPPAHYLPGVRELCDRHGILLCADEVITGFGRLGEWFASHRFGVEPHLITCAKGLSSAYAAIGALIASERVMEPFRRPGEMYSRGMTFGGHPVQAAVALRNIEIMRRERVIEHVRATEADFRAALEPLLELPIVGDLRGAGFFYALELVKDQDARTTFSDEECDRLLRGFLSSRLFERGLLCRADDRGEPVVQTSPPLVARQEQFDEIAGILGGVLEASDRMAVPT
mgnify:CR=1 FL=1